MRDYGYNFGSTAKNSWNVIRFVVIIFIVNVLFYPKCNNTRKDATKNVTKWFWKKVIESIHFSFYVRVFMCLFLILSVHFMLELFAGPEKEYSYWINFGIIFMYCLMFAVVLLYQVLLWKNSKYLTKFHFSAALGNLRDRRFFTLLHPLLFYVKRFLVACLIVIFKENHTSWGIVLLAILNVITLLYSIGYRPYNSW